MAEIEDWYQPDQFNSEASRLERIAKMEKEAAKKNQDEGPNLSDISFEPNSDHYSETDSELEALKYEPKKPRKHEDYLVRLK